MGKTIEQIRIGKTSKSLRATSSFFRYGPDPLITIPARGFWNAAQRGLTEDRTRSHANRVRNFLHHGRQPQKRLLLAGSMMPQLCGKSTYPGFADFRSHLSRTTNLPTEWNQAHDTQIQREYGLHEKTRQFGSGLHPID